MFLQCWGQTLITGAACLCVLTPFASVCLQSFQSSGRSGLGAPCSSLPFPVLGGSAGGVADDVREARPPDQGGASGDDEQALQGRGVVGRVGTAAQASSGDVVYVGDAETGLGVGAGAVPAVLPEGQRAAD